MQTKLYIDPAPDFSFKATVYSHGWCELAPFGLDEENWRLSYVFLTPGHKVVPVVLFEEAGRIAIEAAAKVAEPEFVVDATRHLLRLDDDLTGLYNVISGHDRLGWIAERRAGRLLRSPTVFEDLVKTICTTNCS
jgi:N-glycosylase/DNA lyase